MQKTSSVLKKLQQENINKNSRIRVEIICFSLFVLLYFIASCFHEPMYDEAQAWLIARDASWRELIFQIPHYEGHPPLWHLILAVFAKTGIPFEIGLRIPGAFFSVLTAGLIIFRSPFPRPIKCLLPFTYYIFFRYSIVVRPYCISMLAFCLVAMLYEEKHKKPFRFIAALMLLCASSAYGMTFAAGICVVWIIELFGSIRDNYKKQALAMFLLLVCNIVQLLMIMPYEDTNSVSVFSISTYIYGLIYMFIIGPADAMFLDVGMDARLQNYAEGIVCGGMESVINLLLGGLTVLLLVFFAKKYRKLLLFTIPYVFFALFSSVVYFWYHHIGLIHLYIIFVFWCALSGNGPKEVKSQRINNILNNRYVVKFLKLSLIVCLGMSLAWSTYCVATDLFCKTWYTKELAEAVREVGVDQGNCALQWDITGVGPFENPEDYYDASKYSHTPSVTQFFDCLAYFDENIFYNHNNGNKDISYNRQIIPDYSGQMLIMEEIAEYGYPEFIIGYPFVLDALPIEDEMPGYVPVYRFEVYKPDKFIIDYNDRYIYAREDIYQQRSDWPIKEQLSAN